ncbi:hypothetical protein CsatA_002658 [Cannabis sativa]
MEMKKIVCAVIFAAASVSAVVAQETTAAPAPSPTSAATSVATLPLLGVASLVSLVGYYLH